MPAAKRKAKKVTIPELHQRLRECLHQIYDFELDENSKYEDFPISNLFDGKNKFSKDISKIEFDFENTYLDASLDGFHTIEDLSYFGVTCGGDWEEPIFFIVYLDTDNTIRGYVPKDGNCYNKKTKSAFGNDEDEDDAYIQKFGYSDLEEYLNDFGLDQKLLEKDLLGRIHVD